MKKIKNLLLLLFFLSFASCGDNSKNSSANNNSKKSTMTWTTNAKGDMIEGESMAKTEEDLTSEIEQIFIKIKTEKLFKTTKVLVFIDATNSVLFFSDYEDKHMVVYFPVRNLLGENSDATDFDIAMLTSLREAIRTDVDGKKIMADYTVYFQTETDEPEILK